MTQKTSSIMLVDDHPLLRKGLQQLIELSDGLKLVAQANSGAEALQLAPELDPDLILLDLNMQGMDGLETLEKLRAAEVTSRIVMLTVSDADEDVIGAISRGADGYLLKDMEPEELLNQINRALEGKMVMSEAVTRALASAIRRPHRNTATQLDSLTARELEILKLIAKG